MAARQGLARLSFLANRAANPRAVIPMRGGGGGPVAQPVPPKDPVPEEDELTWDDGTANPEPALDKFDLVSSNHALGMLLAGLSVFAVVGYAAKKTAPEERVPWAPRQMAYDYQPVLHPAEAESK